MLKQISLIMEFDSPAMSALPWRQDKELWEALTRQSSKLALYEIKRSCGFSAAEIREMKLPEAVPGASVTLICEAFGLARVAYYATGKPNKTRSGGPAARETAGGNRPFVCSDDVVVILNFRLDLLNAFSFPTLPGTLHNINVASQILRD